MVVLLHGAAGGWDELAIAVAAFVVLWVAIKLAGRKPAGGEDDDDGELETTPAGGPTEDSSTHDPSQVEVTGDPAHSSSTHPASG